MPPRNMIPPPPGDMHDLDLAGEPSAADAARKRRRFNEMRRAELAVAAAAASVASTSASLVAPELARRQHAEMSNATTNSTTGFVRTTSVSIFAPGPFDHQQAVTSNFTTVRVQTASGNVNLRPRAETSTGICSASASPARSKSNTFVVQSAKMVQLSTPQVLAAFKSIGRTVDQALGDFEAARNAQHVTDDDATRATTTVNAKMNNNDANIESGHFILTRDDPMPDANMATNNDDAAKSNEYVANSGHDASIHNQNMAANTTFNAKNDSLTMSSTASFADGPNTSPQGPFKYKMSDYHHYPGAQPSDPSEVAKKRPLRFHTTIDDETEELRKFMKFYEPSKKDEMNARIKKATEDELVKLKLGPSAGAVEIEEVAAKRKRLQKRLRDLMCKPEDDEGPPNKKAKILKQAIEQAVARVRDEDGLEEWEGKSMLRRCLRNSDDNGRFAREYMRLGYNLSAKKRRAWLTEKFEEFFWLHNEGDVNQWFVPGYGGGPVQKKGPLPGVESDYVLSESEEEEEERAYESESEYDLVAPVVSDKAKNESEDDTGEEDEDDLPIPFQGAVDKMEAGGEIDEELSGGLGRRYKTASRKSSGSTSSGEGIIAVGSPMQED